MTFISFRRHYVDQMFSSVRFSGAVLDVGGQKVGKRGSFHPPLSDVECWHYLNIEEKFEPDFICSADDMSLVQNDTYDFVVLTEVLEHLQNPERTLQEIHRVLKPSGKLVASMPFLYGIHGDPDDFQRWTPSKFENVMNKQGWLNVEVNHMGGFGAVFYDLYYMYWGSADKGRDLLKARVMRKLGQWIIAPVVRVLEKREGEKKRKITTGWFVTAQKS